MPSLRDLASRLENAYLGDDYVLARCLWHKPDRHPSLYIKRGGYRCFACGVHGPLDELERRLSGVPVPQTTPSKRRFTPYLPDDLHNYAWEKHRILRNVSQVQWYVKDRGLFDMVGPALLGWDQGWITIPIRARSGDVEGMILRADSEVEERTGMRFYQPGGQKGQMYVPMWDLLRDATRVCVTFGMFDAIALASLGIPTVTTTAGKDSFNPEWLDWFRGKIIILPDYGEKVSGNKLANHLDWRGIVHMLDYPRGLKDPADMVQAGWGEKVAEELEEYFLEPA